MLRDLKLGLVTKEQCLNCNINGLGGSNFLSFKCEFEKDAVLVTFILGNKAGGKENLLPALYFRTIVPPEAIFFSQ